MAVDDRRDRFNKHFANSTAETHSSLWDPIWQANLTLWDRGKPSPALADTLNDLSDVFPQAVIRDDQGNIVRRRRALVPGCGTGYDVLLLSAFGYDAVGLDVSEHAVAAARKFAEESGEKVIVEVESEMRRKEGRGGYSFVAADFFSQSWRKEEFDLVYDYTFFCAIPPSLRPSWARSMTDLLAKNPESRLICLEAPLGKGPETGGPPFGLKSEVYVAHLGNPGVEIPYGSDGWPAPMSTESEGVLRRIAHRKAPRTHTPGGGDFVSIWSW